MQAAFKSMDQLSYVLALMANDTGVIGTGKNLEGIANKYTVFLDTMSVDKTDLNPTLNSPLYTCVHKVLSQRPDPECWLLQLQQHQQKGITAEKCKMQFITYLLKDVKCRFIYLSLCSS